MEYELDSISSRKVQSRNVSPRRIFNKGSNSKIEHAATNWKD